MLILKEKMLEKKEKIKGWIGENKELVRFIYSTAIFALLSFFWAYLMSGKPLIAFIFLIAGAAVFVTKKYTFNKKKIFFRIFFWSILILAIIFSLLTGSNYGTLFATVLWLILYVSFEKKRSLKEWIAGALIPYFISMYAEFMQCNFILASKYLFSWSGVERFGYAMGILIVGFVVFFLTQVFNSKKIAYYVTGGLFGFLSIVNFFVIGYTDQAFTLSDLKIATTAAGVMGSQKLDPVLWIRFAVGIILLIGYFVAISFIYKRKNPKIKVINRIAHVLLLGFVAVFFFVESSFLYNTLLLFNGQQKYGYITYFYVTLDAGVKIPDDAKNYVIKDENDEGDYAPNIIIIMNEAFSDLGTTFDLELNEDPLEYFHSLQEQYPSGITYSSVKGNNTCSSEWELLSGSPTALTAKGAMIYQDNCKSMRSLVSLLNSRGYTTVGLHPYYNFGYNRENMYEALGFDETYFIEDLPNDLETYRGYISDKADYEQLIKLYEENEANGDSPFFCFNITMQNHGGYVNQQSDTIHTTTGNTHSDVNTYLSVLNQSDEALKTLLSYFENIEEDTIILFFGDHQPMVDNSFYEELYGKSYNELTLEELTNLYEVPYLIWANYDLAEESAPEVTSNCYLSNVLFEVGNIPKSTWLNMVDEYQKTYPIITSLFIMNANGEIANTETVLSIKSEYPDDKLMQYKMYSYGILYGENEK